MLWQLGKYYGNMDRNVLRLYGHVEKMEEDRMVQEFIVQRWKIVWQGQRDGWIV
jgi:hypothetical protein